jgi:hypothetical protein
MEIMHQAAADQVLLREQALTPVVTAVTVAVAELYQEVQAPAVRQVPVRVQVPAAAAAAAA